MQRFGTAAIPTHSIGLALLKSDWHLAVSLILRPRPGEHPDVLAARRAWLDDGDLDRALEAPPSEGSSGAMHSRKLQETTRRDAQCPRCPVDGVYNDYPWLLGRLTRNAVSDRSHGT